MHDESSKSYENRELLVNNKQKVKILKKQKKNMICAADLKFLNDFYGLIFVT